MLFEKWFLTYTRDDWLLLYLPIWKVVGYNQGRQFNYMAVKIIRKKNLC